MTDKLELSDECVDGMSKLVTAFSGHLDQELANRIVAAGVGVRDAFRPYMYSLGPFEGVRYEADKFVRDWRVAGAMLELIAGKPNWLDIALDRKCRSEPDNVARCWISTKAELEDDETYHARDESMPRAINEACCDAWEVFN